MLFRSGGRVSIAAGGTVSVRYQNGVPHRPPGEISRITTNANGELVLHYQTNPAPSSGPILERQAQKALPAPKGPFADHHLFPRQYKEFFKARNIDIDEYAVTLEQNLMHLKGVHGKGNMGQMPGKWNKNWGEFIIKNPDATPMDVYQQLGKMMDDYNLSGLPIHPYRHPLEF